VGRVPQKKKKKKKIFDLEKVVQEISLPILIAKEAT